MTFSKFYTDAYRLMREAYEQWSETNQPNLKQAASQGLAKIMNEVKGKGQLKEVFSQELMNKLRL